MKTRSILTLLCIFIVLGVLFVVSKYLKAPSPPDPVIYVWNIQDSDLVHIKISLPRENMSRSFVKIPDDDRFPWFFDDPKKSPIDTERWGGGIPLLLSGPSADRIIAENPTDEQLAVFGLTKPSMEITLTLADGKTMTINVGDNTPNANNYYVKVSDMQSVATVDFTWYSVLRNLVKNPPYAKIADL